MKISRTSVCHTTLWSRFFSPSLWECHVIDCHPTSCIHFSRNRLRLESALSARFHIYSAGYLTLCFSIIHFGLVDLVELNQSDLMIYSPVQVRCCQDTYDFSRLYTFKYCAVTLDAIQTHYSKWNGRYELTSCDIPICVCNSFDYDYSGSTWIQINVTSRRWRFCAISSANIFIKPAALLPTLGLDSVFYHGCLCLSLCTS